MQDEHTLCKLSDRLIKWERGFRHVHLDLAAFVLEEEEQGDEEKERGFVEGVGKVWEIGRGVEMGEEVVLAGMEIEGEVGYDEKVGKERVIEGEVVRVEEKNGRGFIRTKGGYSVIGMCGGPIVDGRKGRVVGMLEGLIPENSDLVGGGEGSEIRRQLAGCSVFILGDQLKTFVEHVEKEYSRDRAASQS